MVLDAYRSNSRVYISTPSTCSAPSLSQSRAPEQYKYTHSLKFFIKKSLFCTPSITSFHQKQLYTPPAIMHFNASVILAGLLSFAAAERMGPLRTRASSSFPIPASKGSVTYKTAKAISGTFDGGYKTYGRGVKCGGQAEGGNADAVFLLADGATLKNAIIGKDQNEGVHCLGACTIENVWWDAVCEDALTFKGNGNGKVIGGGARGATDKVIQHNGVGSITIDGFTVTDFGKLYRSCGNCKQNG
jgi:hypothetical protein